MAKVDHVHIKGEAEAQNFSVYVRIKPNAESVRCGDWRPEGNSLSHVADSGQRKEYLLDGIFDDGCATRAVYDRSGRSIVKNVAQGINCTVFAYGQTSSGKTHTMRGSPKEEGFISMVVKDLFEHTATEADRQFLLRASYMELYNEEVNDLLDANNKNLSIKGEQGDSVVVAGLSEQLVYSYGDVLELIRKGDAVKKIGETKMNQTSSRSHTIFRMVVESQKIDGTCEPGECAATDDNLAVRIGVMNLVDLAGSERLSKTGAEGTRLREGVNINKSLLTLGIVIKALSEGAAASGRHVPYRDSKLTRILQPSLGGNARTVMLCMVTLAAEHTDETHNTLGFATRAKQVVNNVSVVETLSSAALLRRQAKEIENLKRQLAQDGNGDVGAEIAELQQRLLDLEKQAEVNEVQLQKLENEKTFYLKRNIELGEEYKRAAHATGKRLRRGTMACGEFNAGGPRFGLPGHPPPALQLQGMVEGCEEEADGGGGILPPRKRRANSADGGAHVQAARAGVERGVQVGGGCSGDADESLANELIERSRRLQADLAARDSEVAELQAALDRRSSTGEGVDTAATEQHSRELQQKDAHIASLEEQLVLAQTNVQLAADRKAQAEVRELKRKHKEELGQLQQQIKSAEQSSKGGDKAKLMLQKELEASQKRYSQLETKFQGVAAERQKAVADKATQERKAKQLEAQLRAMQKDLDKKDGMANKRLETMQEKLDKANAGISSLEVSRKQHLEHIASKNQETEGLQQRLAETVEKLSLAEADLQACRAEADALIEDVAERDNLLEAASQEHAQQMRELDQEFVEAREQVMAADEELDKSREQVGQLTAELEAATAEARQLDDERGRQEEGRLAAEGLCEQLRSELRGAAAHEAGLQAAMRRMEDDFGAQKQEWTRWADGMEQQHTKLREEAQASARQVELAQAQIDRCASQLQAQQSKLQALTEERDALVADLVAASTNKSQVSEQLGSVRKQLETNEVRHRADVAELERLQAQLRRADAAADERDAAVKGLRSRLQAGERAAAEQDAALVSCRQDIQALTTKLQAECRAKGEAERAADEARQELRGALASNAAVASQLQNMEEKQQAAHGDFVREKRRAMKMAAMSVFFLKVYQKAAGLTDVDTKALMERKSAEYDRKAIEEFERSRAADPSAPELPHGLTPLIQARLAAREASSA